MPGSLPGPSRWKERPGRIMVMVIYIALNAVSRIHNVPVVHISPVSSKPIYEQKARVHGLEEGEAR